MASKDHARDIEEQYVLRVQDSELAERIRTALRSDPDESPHEATPSNNMQILFEGDDDTRGKLVFEDQAYPLTVLNLPCVTESYKTYDDINLVKTTDIGQVLVVGLPEVTAAAAVNDIAAEVKDGITPPMRNARQRMFRKPFNVAPSTVHDVEQQMLAILHGGVPVGYKFEDHEEVWQINPQTGKGEWVSVKPLQNFNVVNRMQSK